MYIKVFGYKCFILNTKDNLENFDSIADKGIFLAYSTSSKAYKVFNKRTLVVEESMHIISDESKPLEPRKNLFVIDDFVGDFIEVNLQDKDALKPLELEGPTKKETDELPLIK